MFDNIKAGIRRVFSRSKTITRIEDVFDGLLIGINLSQLRNYESYLLAGSKKIWATWKACDITAKVVIDTPQILRKLGGDGTPVRNREIEKLMNAPNAFDTWAEMVFKTVFHMKLSGNAFWAKDGVNLKGARPSALYLLNPKRMRLVVDPNKGITGYIYTPMNGGI